MASDSSSGRHTLTREIWGNPLARIDGRVQLAVFHSPGPAHSATILLQWTLRWEGKGSMCIGKESGP